MKKKKKGFTLTELIAVIVVLALIALIAIPAYNTIRKRTLERQYENTVTLIETAAEKYASKTGHSVAIVKELIEAGLIESDDGEDIYDPRDKKSLKCYPVEIEYKKGKYKGRFIEKEVEGCSGDAARSEYSDITILVNGKEYKNEWLGDNAILSVRFEEEIEKSNLKYNWVTNSGQTSEEETIEISTTNVFNGTVNVTVKGETNRYFTITELKIDKESPIIEDTEISGGSNWEKERVVKVEATDKNGSGIAGYYVSSSPCNESTIYQEEKEYKFTKDEISLNKPNTNTPATYYVCVKDKVGLVTSKEIKLDAVDKEAPECVWSGESTSWASQREITVSCNDSISGCHPDYDSYSETINTTTRTITMSYTIKDNAGNETICSKEVNVYVDKTAPSIPGITNPSSGNWTKNDFSLTLSSTDDESDIAYYQYTYNANATTTGSNNTTNWVTYSDSAKQSYTTTPFSAERNQLVYIRACDVAGNCSTKSNTYIRIDKSAPSTPSISLKYSDNETTYNQVWTNRNVKQVQSSTDAGVGGIYYQYGHDNSTWVSMPKDWVISWEGNWNYYVRACDALDNCSSSAPVYWIGIDKTAPSIQKTSKNSADCLSYYKSQGACVSSQTKCIELKISDNLVSYSDLKVQYSLCFAGTSTTSKASCNYNGGGFGAYDRLSYYVTNGSCKSPGDIYDNKCYKTWTNSKFTEATWALCTSYNKTYTINYALRVCDPANNCSSIITASV